MSYRPFLLVPLAPLATVAATAHSVEYLSVEQAQRQLFPESTAFEFRPISLGDDEIAAIEELSDISVSEPEIKVWIARKGSDTAGYFYVDQVLGKHEFITYALALDTSGAVKGLEILVYRETYGGQVRQARWRDQFVGKQVGAPLQLDEDIINISGATLSCRHISDGVKRILATHRTLFGKEPHAAP